VVIGLIASAALILMNGENFGYETSDIVKSAALCCVTLVLSLTTKIHPIILIIAAGFAGWLMF
jgi:chromate transporter